MIYRGITFFFWPMHRTSRSNLRCTKLNVGSIVEAGLLFFFSVCNNVHRKSVMVVCATNALLRFNARTGELARADTNGNGTLVHIRVCMCVCVQPRKRCLTNSSAVTRLFACHYPHWTVPRQRCCNRCNYIFTILAKASIPRLLMSRRPPRCSTIGDHAGLSF